MLRYPFSRLFHVLALSAASSMVLAQVSQTPITVQVINDSGLPDTEVMLLLAGKAVGGKDAAGKPITYPFSVAGVPSIDITGTPPSAVSAGPLVCPRRGQPGYSASCSPLELAPFTINSPYSGARGLPVYQFTMATVGSGSMYVAYAPGSATLTMPPAPTITSPFRFQPIEFSYSSAIVSNGDLTSIDFYGIPLQLQTFAAGDTTFQTPVDKVTYYTSTPTLLNAMLAANPDFRYTFWNTSGALFRFNQAKASYTAADFLTFSRMVGPNQAASAWSSISPVFYPKKAPTGWSGTWPPSGSAGAPWPYPSFTSYLGHLASTGYSFTEADKNNISAYTFNYSGKVLPMTATTIDTCLPAGLAAPGYYIKLTGTTSGAKPLADNMDLCIPLPTNGVAATYSADGKTQLTPPIGSGDFVIYGATQNCETLALYSSDGNNGNPIGLQPCIDSNATQLGALANSIYGWIQADVLSALNFGYLQGQADATWNGGQGKSGIWYAMPPAQYPFGAARATNDGFYNPWAALMYNHSDAYGFAFSDRKGRPSPDIAFPIGGTLRLWILPDVRLDAPLAQVQSTGLQSVTLAWPRVSNAGSYLVTWGPAAAPTTQTVQQPGAGIQTVSTRITGLNGNSPYRFAVRTIGNTGTRKSTEMTVYATTQGIQPQAAAGNLKWNFSMNWTPPSFLGATPELWIGGTQATYSAANGGYAVAGLPITVGPASSSAALNVMPAPGTASAPFLTATIDDQMIAPGDTANLTVTINNPTADALSLNQGYSITLPSTLTGSLPLTPPAGACPGAVVNGSVVQLGSVPVAAQSSCTISVALVSTTPGTVLIVAPELTVKPAASGSPPVVMATAVNVPLTITGGVVQVSQVISPATITSGQGAAVLRLTLANASAAPLTLLQAFSDELPPGVTATLMSSADACAGAGLDVTNSIISLPKGSTIPVGGCSIVAALAATTIGSVTNTTGPLLTNATVVPTQNYPVVLRMPKSAAIQPGAVLWSGNLYLSFLGTPWSYSVGPCELSDKCAGAVPAPQYPTPYSTRLVPNYLERQDAGAGLSIAGGVQPLGPPFESGTPAAIGVSFTPTADKRFLPVVVPAP
jgi:hypothetical protein